MELKMARGRAQLSEKLERIMVQSQLMGLTTSDMVKIANRMRALDAERAFKEEVDRVTEGMSFEKKGTGFYTITSKDGRVYEFTRKLIKERSNWWRTEAWDVVVTQPGTRFKPRKFADFKTREDMNEVARACPNGEKKLYRLMKAIYNRKFD
jgi:hypothetical protein